MNNIIFKIFSLLKFNRQDYSVFFLIIFACTVTESYAVFTSFALSDILYFILGIICILRKPTIFKYSDQRKYLVLFILIVVIKVVFYNSSSKMLLSQFRFIYNFLIYLIIFSYYQLITLQEQKKAISTYIYVCTIFSLLVIIQYISFNIFHYNLVLDITNTEGQLANHASYYVYSEGVNYRTGGMFREPSYFALFLTPILEITFRLKKYLNLLVCMVGLIFSTSSMGFLFIGIFMFFHTRTSNFKYLILGVGLFVGIYLAFPIAFARLIEAFNFGDDAENSNNARVLFPFTTIFSEGYIYLFGVDTQIIYDKFDKIFLNTFLYILVSFGVLGICSFLWMIYRCCNLYFLFYILLAIIIEGCYGRIDFWMMLLAASMFSYINKIHVKYESRNNRR